MKKIAILLFLWLVLASCTTQQQKQVTQNNKQTNNNLTTNTNQNMENTGSTQNWDTKVIIDTNNPMAWKTLVFDIEIVKIDKKGKNNTKKDTVQPWDSIEVNYKWTFTDGKQFDSSYDRKQTLPFTVWAGQMIPGFDKAVVWMKVWEKKTVTLKPEEAYGQRDPNKKQEIVITAADKKNLEAAWYEIKKWAKFPTRMGELEILEVEK